MAQWVSFWAAVTLYALATVLFFVWLSFRREGTARLGWWATVVGLVPHAAALAWRWHEVGHGPFSTRYEVLSANAFVLVGLFLLSSAAAPTLRGLGAFVMPAVFVMLGFAVDTFEVRNEVPVIFKSAWLYLHIGFAKAFGAATLLAAAAAAAYFAKARGGRHTVRLPAAERLDLYAHQFLLVAFLCLGVMIVAGSLWAHQSWGRYWAWDPIETSALSTWIAYGIILHFRIVHRWSGRRMAGLTFVALGLMLVTLYVVVLVTPTIHDFYLVDQP